MSNVVFGMEKGVGHVCIEKSSTNAKASQDYCPCDKSTKRSVAKAKKIESWHIKKIIPRAHTLWLLFKKCSCIIVVSWVTSRYGTSIPVWKFPRWPKKLLLLMPAWCDRLITLATFKSLISNLEGALERKNRQNSREWIRKRRKI